ncbi:hypothetical protein ACFWPH_00840 [Nocardia sp. NPDC058499]|uniref:hypothetical protein n=1 Tax=Nocardia sp. NPDC058499 TaxID=3346530 RepID=UPI00364F3F42
MNEYDPAAAQRISSRTEAAAFSSRPHLVPITTEAAHSRGEPPERLVANSPGPAGAVSGPAPDPVIGALLRLRSFLREGGSFIARLAERMPQMYFSGWSL